MHLPPGQAALPHHEQPWEKKGPETHHSPVHPAWLWHPLGEMTGFTLRLAHHEEGSWEPAVQLREAGPLSGPELHHPQVVLGSQVGAGLVLSSRGKTKWLWGACRVAFM